MGEAQKDTGPPPAQAGSWKDDQGPGTGEEEETGAGGASRATRPRMGLIREFLFGDPFALWVRAVQRRNSFGVPVLVLVRASSFRACELCCVREFFGKFLFRAPVPCLVL